MIVQVFLLILFLIIACIIKNYTQFNQNKGKINKGKINKVIHLGLPRTGTTSLTSALEMLGYNAYHSIASTSNCNINAINNILNSGIDAIVEIPIFRSNFTEKDIDPDIKYILTIRDEDEWYKSIKKHELSLEHRITSLLFTDKWKKEYKSYDKHLISKHTEKIKHIFRNNDNLLVINILDKNTSNSYKWEKLSSFLEIESDIKSKFPKSNTTVRAIVQTLKYGKIL